MQFVKLSIIGTDILFMGRARIGIMSGLSAMIFGYAVMLATVYVMAVAVEALAPRFNAERNRLQALKLVTYAYTAIWIASIGPWCQAESFDDLKAAMAELDLAGLERLRGEGVAQN